MNLPCPSQLDRGGEGHQGLQGGGMGGPALDLSSFGPSELTGGAIISHPKVINGELETVAHYTNGAVNYVSWRLHAA